MNEAFPLTRWSMVAAVRNGGDSAVSRTALAELCRLYWYPLYSFARGTGLSPEDAEDRTQDFFATLLDSNLLARADPNIGRLRSFLLTAFKHDLADAHRRATTLRRGGAIDKLPLEEAEARLQAELIDGGSAPDAAYDLRWAIAVLDGAVERLRSDFTAGGNADLFAALRPFLSGETDPTAAYDTLCRNHGMTREAARQAVHRLRERFRAALRMHVADTLIQADDDAIDQEIAALQAALAGKAR